MTDIVERLRSKHCCDTPNCNCDAAAEEIERLRSSLQHEADCVEAYKEGVERLRAELTEQCRLLGMSAEREAKHLAQITALEKERDSLRAEIGEMQSTWLSGDVYETLMRERAETLKEMADMRAEIARLMEKHNALHVNAKALHTELQAAHKMALHGVEWREEAEKLGAELTETRSHWEQFADAMAANLADRDAEIDRLRAELDALKAWKEEVEKQEPVGVLHVGSWYGEELQDWEFEADQTACDRLNEAHQHKEASLSLYACPAPAQSVPDAVIKAAMEAQREGCAEIVLQAAHKAADCNNLRDYELLRALSIAVAKAPEAKP